MFVYYNGKRRCARCCQWKEVSKFYPREPYEGTPFRPLWKSWCKQCYHDHYEANAEALGKRKPRNPVSPFADLIREARHKKGWRQHTLAEYLGMSIKSVRYYESGKKQPGKLETIEQLATLLEIDKEDLLANWRHATSIGEGVKR